MSVMLFIRTRDGDFNLDAECESKIEAKDLLTTIIGLGGYWADEGSVFIPWHRVDYAEIRNE